MSTGRKFESFVRDLEKSFKDSPHTEVQQNVKLMDRSGIDREFDVLIRTKVNKVAMCIAIECKDYKRKVSIEKIDAFVEKCASVPIINRRIFVSKSGYQSGAIKKATDLGVALHALADIDEETLQKWISDFGLVLHDIVFDDPSSVTLFSKPMATGIHGQMVLRNDSFPLAELTLDDFLNYQWGQAQVVGKKDAWKIFDSVSKAQPGVQSFPMFMHFEDKGEGWFVELDSERYYLKEIRFDFTATLTKVALAPAEAKSYHELGENSQRGRLLSYDLLGVGITMNLVPLEENNDYSQLFITDLLGNTILGNGATIIVPKDLPIHHMGQISEKDNEDIT